MRSTENISVLCVGQDNLFADLPGCAVDHVPTGTTITPLGTRSKGLVRRFPAIVARVCSGKYDLIVLPAIDFRWAYDDTFTKRAVRRIVSAVLRFRPISACVNRLLSRRATRVIVLDRYDSHETLADYLRCVTCARYYFKTNLRETDNNRTYTITKGRECQFKFLPYWIAIENYQGHGRPDKEIDVFFAGAVNSEQRRVAIDRVRRLESEGFRIKIVEGHLPFAEYLSLMSRSWLTLSPQGYGYNGFRHYESMLVGSVPVINLPDPPIVHDFRHGRNCFLYSPAGEDLTQVIKDALSDKSRLLRLAAGLPEFVVGQHSMRAVGSYLLREALADRDGGSEEISDAESAATGDSRYSSSLFDQCAVTPAAGRRGGT